MPNVSPSLFLTKQELSLPRLNPPFRLVQFWGAGHLACQKGEALFFARGNHIALRVEASPMEHTLATTDPAELIETPPCERVARNLVARSDCRACGGDPVVEFPIAFV